MQVFVLERVIPPLVITSKLAVDSVSSNHIFALFLFLFNSHYLKKSVHGPGPKPFYKNKKVSMEPVRSGGPWSPGPCFVLWIQIQSNHRIEFSNLSFPIAHLPAGRLTCANSGEIFVADPPSSGFMNGGRQNFPPNSHKWHEPPIAGSKYVGSTPCKSFLLPVVL